MSLLQYISVSSLTAAVLSVAVIFTCHANEQSRRFPLELEIVAANAKALVTHGLSERRKQALQHRLASSLGTLRFLAREYLQAQQVTDPTLLDKIDRLRNLFKNGKLQRFMKQSHQLAQVYPADLTGLLPANPTPANLLNGRRIYNHLCMGCHTYPDRQRAMPAQDLFDMARTLPQRELIARLVCGVHGTPAVALRNPFSDAELAGLAAYLIQGQTSH